MSKTNYDYRGMIVEYWDLLRGDTSKWSSRPYFLKIIQDSGQPALDVACGTGRLLLDYMQEGVDIDGVDISPEMITLARENAGQFGLKPDLYVQAMQELKLPRRYQTIIVPSSSFLHLTNRADARQALERFYQHLNPGGILAISMRVSQGENILKDESGADPVLSPAGRLLAAQALKVASEVKKGPTEVPSDKVAEFPEGAAIFGG